MIIKYYYSLQYQLFDGFNDKNDRKILQGLQKIA